MGKSLFWKGVIYGALAGGALSLLDKNTRQSVMKSCKKTTSEISFYVKHPDEVVSHVKEVTNKIKTTVEQVSADVSFITGKVGELRDGASQVAEFVEDTKHTFLQEDQNEADSEKNKS
ncbi:YtxH domain-containing protein [Bacillus sp. FJAT-29790]|uniref:YtxH domain-containing protein n=1 Tax=Bacillus sp. FJAT-29790 TaxID=1895002 RepID=UPI001C23B8AC|nr:YtxH domain-containing protein [Bacillus sp. FJAT-29790]MBU8880514.1 YtxH domain-containing protein [Bacillus sp. FJAT-29790]